jgi:hypothetical protein
MRFADLAIGQEFDWVDDTRHFNSFFLRCRKVSTRKYVDSQGYTHEVGTVNASVFHVSPIVFTETERNALGPR